MSEMRELDSGELEPAWVKSVIHLFRFLAPGLLGALALRSLSYAEPQIVVLVAFAMGPIAYAWARGISRTEGRGPKILAPLRWIVAGNYGEHLDRIRHVYSRPGPHLAPGENPRPWNRLRTFLTHQQKMREMPDLSNRSNRESDQYWCLSACAAIALFSVIGLVGYMLFVMLTIDYGLALNTYNTYVFRLILWGFAFLALRVAADRLLRTITAIDIMAIDAAYQEKALPFPVERTDPEK